MRDPVWLFERQAAMDNENAVVLIERAQVRDKESGRNTAFFIKRILDRIAALEADVARARKILARLDDMENDDGEPGLDSNIRWLESITKAEAQIQNLHKELAQYTDDDRLYAARVKMTEGQSRMIDGITGSVHVMFGASISRPTVLVEGIVEDGEGDMD